MCTRFSSHLSASKERIFVVIFLSLNFLQLRKFSTVARHSPTARSSLYMDVPLFWTSAECHLKEYDVVNLHEFSRSLTALPRVFHSTAMAESQTHTQTYTISHVLAAKHSMKKKNYSHGITCFVSTFSALLKSLCSGLLPDRPQRN